MVETERVAEPAFGALLRGHRLAAGLSQEDLAERARMSARGIGALERGDRRYPYRETVMLLAKALGLTPVAAAEFEAAASRPRQPRPSVSGSTRAVRGESARLDLPLALTRLYGRADDIAALRATVSAARLVTLTGTGGVGKTRLALETARTISAEFADGVWLVEFAPLSDCNLVERRIASTLGVTMRDDTLTEHAWIANLSAKRMLLVLDNCEHVLDATAEVAQRILERCPHVRILATSREALHICGERIVPVVPLPVPSTSANRTPSLAEFHKSPAVALFLDRARLIAPAFAVPDEPRARQLLAEVCARLDGLPLAIELAAARMNALSLETLSGMLDRRLHLLTTAARTALPRHQKLSALIDWSYGLLTEAERQTLRQLAVFSGGCTAEAAHAVCAANDGQSEDETLAILCSLVDKSLLAAEPAGSAVRYRMLETTRAFALDRLSSAGERDATERRHAHYFDTLLTREAATYVQVPLREWLAPLELEIDNMRAAMQWSLIAGHNVHLGAAIAAKHHNVFKPFAALQAEAVGWCERAVAALASNPSSALEAPLQLALAELYNRDCTGERAIQAGMRSAALFARVLQGTPYYVSASRGRAAGLAHAAYALARLDRRNEGAAVAAEAVGILRSLGAVAGVEFTLAWALTAQAACGSDSIARRAQLAEALALARSLPPGYISEGLALWGLSILALDESELGQACEYALAAADYFARTGLHKDMTCGALSIAANCAWMNGELDDAVDFARAGLSLPVGQTGSLIDLFEVIAATLAARGQNADAARLSGACDMLQERKWSAGVYSRYTRLVLEQRIALLRQRMSSAQLDAYLAEGRRWSFEQTIAAALDLEAQSRTSGAESFA